MKAGLGAGEGVCVGITWSPVGSWGSQEQQEMAQQERKRQQELRLAQKQERRVQAQQGHRPYFLKRCE